MRLKDIETCKHLTGSLSSIYDNDLKDSITVFIQDGKRVFLNINIGKIVIPAEYRRAWIFSEGLGAIVKNGKVGFVNDKNEIVIPFKFEYNYDRRTSVDFLFKGGYCTVIGANGQHELIDREGKWVVEPIYDYINNLVIVLRIVRRNDRGGVMDSELNLVLPVDYDDVVIKHDGCIVKHDGENKKLAFDGKTVLSPFLYNSSYVMHYSSGLLTDDGDDILVKCDNIQYRVGHNIGLW